MAEPLSTECADFIAYLEQRRDNCEVMITRWPAHEAEGRVMRRQIEVILGDLRAGLHHGAAELRADLAAARAGAEGPL